MTASHPSYSHLYSMWSNSFSTAQATAAPSSALTPTPSSASSPPTNRSYEPSTTPEHTHQSNYGYPPTPPKEVKAEESYFNGASSSLGGLGAAESYNRHEQGSDTYSLPSPSATPTSYDGMYGAFAKNSGSKNKNPNAGK